MASPRYPRPAGVHEIPTDQLDLRPDAEVDHDLLHPRPITDEKNIWLFWHTGYEHMHPYTKRNVRAWHRRFSRQGWAIRVLNREPSSPLNVSQFLDTTDSTLFPQAFTDNTLTGDYALQHISDLVRFPLLLHYGGVYADVGLIQIGDVDRLWSETVANPNSPIDILSYNFKGNETLGLTNYFLAARPHNPFFERCHRLLLKLWEGKSSTEGLHAHPLLRRLPLIKASVTRETDGRRMSDDEVARALSDYIIQGQVITLVMGLVDEEDGWNGPEYIVKHIYAIDYMVGSQLINELTAWNGPRAFELMSLSLPGEGETETADQRQAREIVEACLTRSFAFKLAHGLILKVLGETLGSLWRKHAGADEVPNTYAHWLRYGVVHWCPDELALPKKFTVLEPYKRGPLLEDR